ncbi:protein DpdJ [Roseomonas indoligenes]|uniref:DEAD/DEAH box helicase n=1 Tax=Roseomonas indoligenes TaxID=2820811 RepID=A0A940S8N2_9PROT|nr:protein DpdJ [Pararoseomonas indoligenes]MBP0496274.1 DEAD/DEAH box helicase [Pararoseomonas indoligenes]
MLPEAGALLDAIEEVEMQSLRWGFVDGSLSEEEVLQLARAAGGDERAEEMLEVLLDARLLLQVASPDGTARLRSRYAETVRLLVRLRQLFPGRPWLAAPRLVSDFRIDRRRRRYPRRNLEPADVIDELRTGGVVLTADQDVAWRALTAGMRLAAFQARATARILQGEADAGTIVTAGTGSGKTLAFYLPALLRLLPRVERSAHWVKVLAIYPRTELLKDQFAEAYRLARMLDATLGACGARPIVVGALFGTTPRNAADAAEKWPSHRSPAVGRICPLMACPACGSDLVWRAEDIAAQRERLVCSAVTCRMEVPGSHVVLTRERMLREPPDLLFTTTEILNQRLSDTRMRALLGVGLPPGRRPLLALLDEVHTYVGTAGAQAALTLRRYRHALGSALPFAGLSATLGEAARFFAELVGLPPDAVVEVTPEPSEMVEEGAEYQVLLRGDPSSQASLLSTSIQAAMLLGRALDPPGRGRSGSVFGKKAFVFTDDLDVTNRLFDDLRDAEGLTIFGRRDAGRNPLAALRGPGTDATARDADGQRWRLCEEIGRPLVTPLTLARTTSQDAGVSAAADVVVATAALEVGFNDPDVGAVLQHKAPRSMASFLQRKGRAGRTRAMRPLTVTVLSDYGRDRLAFQAFEHLFDPSLPPQHLPIRNDHVVRIQAVFSLLDWLAARLPRGTRGWMWDSLSRPRGDRSGDEAVRAHVRDTLGALLKGDVGRLDDLRRWLAASLRMDAAVVEALLWQPPRSLLLEAVPTLLRRLVRDWRLADGTGEDIRVDWHPLPDFVPRNLFSELSLPEVRVVLPPATARHTERVEAVPVAKALAQLAPGRVTRRFAPERGKLSHWFPVQPDAEVQDIQISTYCEQAEFLGQFGEADRIPVFRPWRIRLSQAKAHDALPSSNAVLDWRTQLLPQGDVLSIEVPHRGAWRERVLDVRFHLHRFGGSVLVRRYASTAQAELHRRDGSFSIRVQFRGEGGELAAVGYEFEADGFYLDVSLPTAEELAAAVLPSRLRASCRSAYFRYRVLSDEKLPPAANAFLREWLCQILMSAAIVRSVEKSETIGVALAVSAQDPNSLRDVMTSIFAIQDPAATPSEEDDEDESDADGVPAPEPQASRLQGALMELIDSEQVRSRLGELARELDDVPPGPWGSWLRATLAETVAEAVLQACMTTAPRHAATDTLVLDLEEGPGGQTRIWVTETTLGGAGVVQAFADVFSAEPHALFRAIEAALAQTDLEIAAEGLERFLSMASEHPNVADAADRLRVSLGHEERGRLRQALWLQLARLGLDVPHALAVSLDARLLRPGTRRELDELLLRVIERWDALEAKLGVSIGLREMAYVAASDEDIASAIREVLRDAAPSVPQSAVDLVQVLASLLWPRGIEIRQRSLQSYNPFRKRRLSDPALVRHLLLDDRVPEVAALGADWRGLLGAALSVHGGARVWAPAEQPEALRRVLVEALALPIEVAYLRFFPTVERLGREGGRLIATLSLRECI